LELPSGELTKAIRGLGELLVGCRLLAALERLVLIAHPVHFEIEEVGEVVARLRSGSTSAPSSLLPLCLLQLDLAEGGLRRQEVGEGPLFGRERVRGSALAELPDGLVHCRHGLRKLLRNQLHLLRRARQPWLELGDKGLDVRT